VDSQQTPHANIEQRLHFADDMGHKTRLLEHLLRDTEMNQAIVFTSTKRAADDIAQGLHRQGFSAAALHGDMNQSARTRTLTSLRRGALRVLVATDVAARGIDVQGISHVINYDLPHQPEDYVHRIGRTGRAGRNGIAISFANVRDHYLVKSIERFTSQPIAISMIDGLEPKQREFSKKPPSSRPMGRRPSTNNPNNRSAKPSGGREGGYGGYDRGGAGKPANKTFGAFRGRGKPRAASSGY